MKTKILLSLLTILLIACQPNIDKSANTDLTMLDLTPPSLELNMADAPCESRAPSCNVPPPVETVKFSPPSIKDNAMEENANPNSAKQSLTKNKKIIKDGSITIKVKFVDAAKKRIDELLKTYGAYYENEHFVNYETRTSYDLIIRVPSKQFESFLQASEHSTGEIITKNISARDVTEDYEDSETRLESKRLFRTRYNQLLQKAIKVDDILSIEENIRNLQEEIESQEGHLKYLDDQVAYSTLEINLFTLKAPATTPASEETFYQGLKNSFSNGWQSVISGALWCFSKWPWVVAFMAMLISIKVYKKRRKK